MYNMIILYSKMHAPSLGSTSEHNTCLRCPNTCSCLNRSSFHEGLTECLAILFHQYVPRQTEINRFNLQDSTKTLHLRVERVSPTGSMYYGVRGHISILSMYFKISQMFRQSATPLLLSHMRPGNELAVTDVALGH